MIMDRETFSFRKVCGLSKAPTLRPGPISKHGRNGGAAAARQRKWEHVRER